MSSSYSVAYVRFSVDGKPHPVNCKFSAVQGDFVIVRLEGKFTPLQKAEVVSVDYRKKECKHSVVCMASDAELYGIGPDGIETLEQLDRFLVDFMRLTKVPVVKKKGYGGETEPDPRWHAAYLRNARHGDFQDGFGTASKVVVVGYGEYMYRAPQDGQYIKMANGALIGDHGGLGPAWKADERNVYARAAHDAEWPLFYDASPPDLHSLHGFGLKEDLGGGGYLGDDEYL